MVPVELLSLEQYVGNDTEHSERNDFLYHFELHQIEWATISHISYPIGRNHKTILETGYAPREEYHNKEWPIGGHTCFVEFQVAVPCKRHEDIAANQ